MKKSGILLIVVCSSIQFAQAVIPAPPKSQIAKQFIGRLDSVMKSNSKVDLKNLSAVAKQSGLYNGFVSEAETAFGNISLDNSYNGCVQAAVSAQALWTNIYSYSMSSLSNAHKQRTMNDNKKSYATFKNDCLTAR